MIEKVDTNEVTTPLSMTTADGEAADLTESVIFESTNFHPTMKPLKATTLSEISEGPTTEPAIQVEV